MAKGKDPKGKDPKDKDKAGKEPAGGKSKAKAKDPGAASAADAGGTPGTGDAPARGTERNGGGLPGPPPPPNDLDAVVRARPSAASLSSQSTTPNGTHGAATPQSAHEATVPQARRSGEPRTAPSPRPAPDRLAPTPAATVTTPRATAPAGTGLAASSPPATGGTHDRGLGMTDDLSRLVLVPVDVARRVLPERRLPFYLGVGALAVIGVLEWPVALAAGMAWEALRRRRSS